MHECKQVGMEYFDNAPSRFVASVEIKATAEQIFEAFEDAEAWPTWAMPITNVEWTSPKPFDIGTTRTVSMIGKLVGDEVFIDWDYPKHMAFCFTHCSQSLIESFAESWRVEVLDGGLCKVTWTMGMTPKGFGKLTMGMSKPFMQPANQWMLGKFKQYCEKRFA